jgi:DNA ligase-1
MKQTEKPSKVDNIITVLDELKTRRFTGHNALHLVNSYVHANPGYQKLIYCIIDRDLETRANTTLINKVMPGFIPEFNVALAKPYEPNRCDFEKDEWYASRKLDGVRSICRIDDQGEIQFYSRNGKKFDTLGTLKLEMYKLGLKNIVFDGEICIVEDGLENFQSVMKEIKKKEHTIKNPKFFIFDCLTPDEFNEGTSIIPLLTRLSRIPKIKGCDVLGQVRINSQKELDFTQANFVDKGYEGTMVRSNLYKGKRSFDLMKVKGFIDAEYEVVGTVNDDMRFFEDGEDVERETMASVVIKHKGCDVGVGSGFSKEERAFYYTYPDEIIGKIITIQYFEEIEKKPGVFSLRFPSIKVVHGPERTL